MCEEKKKIMKIIDKDGNIKYEVIPNYRAKKLLTDEESKFFIHLNQLALKYNIMLFCQVALSQIAEVNDEEDYWKWFAKIKQKVIDFVLYDNFKEEIICCIELDDETHELYKRVKRDKFVDEVFDEINIPLIHVFRSHKYAISLLEIENEIIKYKDRKDDINLSNKKNKNSRKILETIIDEKIPF